MIVQYSFKTFKPKFHDFDITNVYIEEVTKRVASFDVQLDGDVILQVADVNHSGYQTQVLQVTRTNLVYKPNVRSAVSKVRKAYKANDYEYKYQSALLVTLEQGYYGALDLLAELVILGLQFQIVKDSFVSRAQPELLTTAKLFYTHVGDNKLIFPMSHLQTKGLSYISGNAYALNAPLDTLLENEMNEAGKRGQSLVGCVEIPLNSTWGNTLTVDAIINIYL